MRKTSSLVVSPLLAAAVLSFAPAASADAIPISIGARVGYGVPTGEGSKGKSLKDTAGGLVPLQADVMYALGFGLRLGLYGSYGILTGLKDGVDSGSQTRVGAQAHFVLPIPAVKPWIGAGIGYEWLTATSKGGGVEVKSTSSGLEMFNLQAGLQLGLLPILSLGPYVQYQMGTFTKGKAEGGGLDFEGDIKETASHGWIQGGLRAELSF